MSISIELILAYVILIPFIIINIIIAVGFLFQKVTGIFLQKALKLDEKYKNSKNRIFHLINLIIWITIGLINVFNLDNPISLGGVLIFLAFRSGTSLSKRLIFGIHDIKLLRSLFSEKKIAKIIAKTVKIGIIIELMFLLTWGILYRYLNVSVKSNFGIEVNILVLVLWFAGFVYGIIFSIILSKISKQFLLKNEIGIVVLLSGELLKEKIKKKNIIPKFFRD
jgi:hypothetical protein